MAPNPFAQDQPPPDPNNPTNPPSDTNPDQTSPSSPKTTDHNSNSGGSHGLGAGWIVLIVIILLLLAGAAYYIYAHQRARKLGRPPPQLNPFADRGNRIPSRNYPARGGVVGWFEAQVRNFRNRRSSAFGGAGYEGTALSDGGGGGLSAGGRKRGTGFGRLDPDEAWDAGVGAEADVYGEGPGGRGPYYGDDEYGYSSVGVDEIRAGGHRGRSRSPRQSELDERYDEVMGVGNTSRGRDPFGDDAAVTQGTSLRGVSPRPVQDDNSHLGRSSKDDSPTERRSMFREDIS